MTAGGFSTALGSFVGQNFGAKKYGRIVKGYQISMLLAGGIGLAAGLAFFFAGDMIFSLFVTEPETYHAGGVYLHILALSQVFMVMETVTAGAFNGLGRTSIPALLSIVLNACRIPMAYGLVTFAILGVTGIWWSITISSILKGTILTLWFYYAIIRKYKHY
ncbi:MAG: MATE family efflux transporter [Barnesiella sp.]